MNSERRMLYISVGVNFFIGVIWGILLFYGQMRNNAEVFDGGYIYNAEASLVDFFRVTYLNSLWMFSIFIAHNILSVQFLYPIMMLRGCGSAFSLMYILCFVGIKEAVCSALPQCISVLPMLTVFSVKIVAKRRENIKNKLEPFSLSRADMAKIFLAAAGAAGAETLLFKLFCSYFF